MNTVQEISQAIDSATEPAKMPKQQAVDFLENLASEIEAKLDALREEIKNEEKKAG